MDLPPSLGADAADFRQASLAHDPLGDDCDHRPVRLVTADQRDRMLRRLASAEVHGGVAPEALQSLADVVRPDHLRQGLAFMLARAANKPSRQVFEMAFLALMIARHWARLPDDDIVQIAK